MEVLNYIVYNAACERVADRLFLALDTIVRPLFPTASYLSVHLPSYVSTHCHGNSSMLTSFLPAGFFRNFPLAWDPNGPPSDLILCHLHVMAGRYSVLNTSQLSRPLGHSSVGLCKFLFRYSCYMRSHFTLIDVRTTYLLTPWPYCRLTALAFLVIDAYSSLSPACFRYLLISTPVDPFKHISTVSFWLFSFVFFTPVFIKMFTK